jgi:hypothetical protein
MNLRDRVDRLEAALATEEPEQTIIVIGVATEGDLHLSDPPEGWLTFPAALAASQPPLWRGGAQIINLSVDEERKARAAAAAQN